MTAWETLVHWGETLPMPLPFDEAKPWIGSDAEDRESIIRLAIHQAIRFRGGVLPGEGPLTGWVVSINAKDGLWPNGNPRNVIASKFKITPNEVSR